MLTKNGKQCYRSFKRTDNAKLKTTEGTNYNASPSGNDFRYYALRVGSGTTAPTVDDYDLEDTVNSLTKLTDSEVNSTDYNSNYISTYVATFKNNTNENVIISEIGVFYAYHQYSGVSNIVLMAREVITPVTIEPGKTYTISITIG